MDILIVEDERDHAESLISMIQSINPFLRILPVATDIEEAINAINYYRPGIVFMDIDLKGRKSFEIFDSISNNNFSLIFCTAHNNYAINAFRLNALDYLLKPVGLTELKNAITKVEKSSFINTQWQQLQNVLMGTEKMKRISLPTNTGIDFINIEDIIRCEADGNYTKFITSSDRYLASKSIGEYDEALTSYGFFRIHKSHLINLQFVKRLSKGESPVLILQNNEELPVARRRKDILINTLNKI
ncbi:MAG: LytR/AlgR family response regulator transcription factor [Flavobacteriales bacterium]